VRGECLACARVSGCGETSVERVLNSYTCLLFEPVTEPVYLARETMMEKYGAVSAVCAMLQRPPETEEEDTNEGEERP
jgi:hypothetical protein